MSHSILRGAGLGLFLALFTVRALAAGSPLIQDKTPKPLGSMTTVGGVFVNGNAVASAETTVFTGDTVRTEDDGVGSFTASGRGTLKISPNSFIVFAGTEQYIADLRSGSVVVSSFSGPSGLTVRIGDYLALPAVQDVQTTTRLERAVAGTSSVACVEGSVSVISLQGASGLLLQAGQASTISATGELSAGTPTPSAPKTEPSVPPNAPSPNGPTKPSTTTPTAQNKKKTT